ncbi:hypothetical protein ILUMI_00155 [Ignelater luminosus]|uniref:Uncharacterized protein n=1 Tax=Ignelater luminosus TaxID=2038154 RepID=A0A8K0DGT0_IGNLU|nr:hypothetical protein ILUMI_00155 [Ignelater luminosus]
MTLKQLKRRCILQVFRKTLLKRLKAHHGDIQTSSQGSSDQTPRLEEYSDIQTFLEMTLFEKESPSATKGLLQDILPSQLPKVASTGKARTGSQVLTDSPFMSDVKIQVQLKKKGLIPNSYELESR